VREDLNGGGWLEIPRVIGAEDAHGPIPVALAATGNATQ
jgi:hypothetical protein